MGNVYTGRVYVNIETTRKTSGALWDYQETSIKTVRVAEGQLIYPRSVQSWFAGCNNLETCDLSGVILEDASCMPSDSYGGAYNIFNQCSKLTFADISGLDTSLAVDFTNIFGSCSKLEKVVLGPNFSFVGQAEGSKRGLLPTPPSSTTSSKWIREDEVYGPYTPTELRDNYTSEMAGTWVWQEKQTKYTVSFLPPDSINYGGSMPPQKIVATEAGTLDNCAFYRFNYHFDHWDGDDGKTYTDGQTIPKNTFAVGDTLTLTAVFEKNDNHLDFSDGEATITLHGGEKATLPDIPGGASYQIWEETPSGWQLVEQINPAGTIPANGTADSSFTNEYVPGTATITLMAKKTLDGRTPEDGQFQFELIGPDNETIQTVSNTGSGLVQFDQLVFKQPGTYEYKIREVRGEMTGRGT